MKFKDINSKEPRQAWFRYGRQLAAMTLVALCCLGYGTQLQAQRLIDTQSPTYTRPSWWFGIAGAGNLNFFLGSTQRLTDELVAPVAFQQGLGLGLYAAPLVEFHSPTSNWGLMLQAGYDSRRGTYNTEFSPCNCPRDLRTNLSYVTAEPSLRFAPFKSNFYIYAGPRVAYNLQKSFVYQQGTNPAYPDQVAEPEVKGDLSKVEPFLISAQVGLGYDIQLSSNTHQTQWVISPFASFQPYFGQSPRSIETWNITTLRAGVAFKVGRGRLMPAEQVEAVYIEPVVVVAVVEDPEIKFVTNVPSPVASKPVLREIFPLRNYVFFDMGSTEIPKRYVLLRKDQVQNFQEKQVQLSHLTAVDNRSERQLLIYYNILNILGDRMVQNPTTTITLVGSSEQGPAEGVAMATSIKTYLVDVFHIDAKRIQVQGRSRAAVTYPSGGTMDIDLLRAGDNRVTIESNSPVLLMEFTSGPSAPLKPVEIVEVPVDPQANDIQFDAAGAKDLASWSLEVLDEQGNVQKFGPYYEEHVSIPAKAILGNRPDGQYTITMIGKTKTGHEVKEYSTAHIVQVKPPLEQEVMRFSVIYEFDESQTTKLYSRYLEEIVVPKIPIGGTVILQGYTDVIGAADHNQKLSLARANDVKDVMELALAARGRKDVKFEVRGYGEDLKVAQFENAYPEGRFYNRAVLIDIVPAK